jgi:hypothetical protein
MIKLKFVGRSTHDTPTPIPMPHLKLDRRWNKPSTILINPNGSREIFVTLDGYEFEFEDLPVGRLLPPGINQMENPIIRPDPLANLLVNPHTLRRAVPSFELLSSLMEQTVLRWTLTIAQICLIDLLGITTSMNLWLVVSLINQDRTTIFELVIVGRSQTDRHENHRVVAPKAEIHSAL